MANPTVVGFSGNFTRPSKTRGFVEHVVKEVARSHGLSASTYDIVDVGSSLGGARWARDLDAQAGDVLRKVVEADVLVVGSPTYKGSYTGLFKHFFDLVDPAALKGKPVVLLATGGGERHALIVEHQLRPLFGFFEAFALPTAVYASDKDFIDGVLVSEAILSRVELVLDDVDGALARRASARLAARGNSRHPSSCLGACEGAIQSHGFRTREKPLRRSSLWAHEDNFLACSVFLETAFSLAAWGPRIGKS